MTNTLNNIPRELLERVLYLMDNYIGTTHTEEDELRTLLSAPSPAGVDGLEVIGWYTEDHLDDKSATTYSRVVADRWLAKGWPITGIANAADAQAIIDGLRGEVDKLMTTFVRVADHLHIDCEKAKSAPGKPSDVFIAAIDQQAQRIGELERLLLEVRNGLSCENLHHKKSEQHAFDEPCKVLGRIDFALSASKEWE